MKYRDNMTPEELAAFKREIDELDAAYASAAQMQTDEPMPEEWEDEMEMLRKAGLNRGRP